MVKLKVEGMSCQHCKSAVEQAIKKVQGVEAVDISLEQGAAVVRGTAQPEQLVDAVKQVGYEAHVQPS